MAQLCDICGAADDLSPVAVAPQTATVTLCPMCRAAVEGDIADAPRWRCLTDAIWSERPEVQVTAWRLLQCLSDAVWARETLEAVYLDPETLAWAQEGMAEAEPGVIHRDSNGAVLAAGDTVTLIKDLVVKGGGFTAKRGTAVRGISLVADNPDQIEGRVNGQQLVLLCQFVKKSG